MLDCCILASTWSVGAATRGGHKLAKMARNSQTLKVVGAAETGSDSVCVGVLSGYVGHTKTPCCRHVDSIDTQPP